MNKLKFNNEERLANFKEHFGKLVNNCKAFDDMLNELLQLEDKRLVYIIINKFWFIERQRCHYWNNLPKNVKSYYRPYFMKNMRNVMLTTLSKCGSIDITAHMINEEGRPVWADESETTYQFNKSRCYGFVLNVLSTYFKIRCKV